MLWLFSATLVDLGSLGNALSVGSFIKDVASNGRGWNRAHCFGFSGPCSSTWVRRGMLFPLAHSLRTWRVVGGDGIPQWTTTCTDSLLRNKILRHHEPEGSYGWLWGPNGGFVTQAYACTFTVDDGRRVYWWYPVCLTNSDHNRGYGLAIMGDCSPEQLGK